MMPNDPWALPPKPGTYRITNVHVPNNVIEVPMWNEERVMCSPWAQKTHQQWVIQYSGRGYKIKNVHHKVYLAPTGSNGKLGAVVGTSPEPTTWMLVRTHQGFLIQEGDEDKVINLHFANAKATNILNIWPSEQCKDHRRWNFEYISDDVGGEVADTVDNQIRVLHARLQAQHVKHRAELAALTLRKNQELAEKEQELQNALQSQTNEQSLDIAGLCQKMGEMELILQAVSSGHRFLNNAC